MILSRLLDLPPRESVRKIRGRILGKPEGFDAEQIIRSPRLMRSQRFYDFLSRYEAILKRAVAWKALDFDGRDVLEIGCGQMLGFGPIAIFCGANSYSGMEPLYDQRVLHDPAIVASYYLSIFKDLSAIYGKRYDFDEFMGRLRGRTKVTAEKLDQTSFSGPFDIIISNSCLEHIFDFDKSMAALHQLCAPECRFVHLIDFASHEPGNHPFDGLFAVAPETFWSRHGKKVNLLRLPEIMQGFENAGFRAGAVPYAHYGDTYVGPVHQYWRERYSDDEILFLKTAIIHSLD